jgi:DNA-binding YbaB/EbfC family protein
MTFPGDLRGLLERATRVREDVERARAALRDRLFEGSAGGGMVVATCDGVGDLRSVRFEEGLLGREERTVVEDLVVAAVRDARRRASEAERETMARAMGPLGAVPGMPGFPTE